VQQYSSTGNNTNQLGEGKDEDEDEDEERRAVLWIDTYR
jgi:hypothetical protein